LARCHPILIVESIKSDKAKLSEALLGHGYRLFGMGLNILAIHETDKSLGHIQQAVTPPAAS
jgi:hypothetical protein